MDNRREEAQTAVLASTPGMPLAEAAQRVNGGLSADWIDINHVRHQWVRTFLQNLENPQPASFLPAIEDIVIWIAEGNQRVATSIYRAVMVLQREFDQSSTRTTDFQTAGKSFYRALKCLRIAKWDSERAKGMLRRVREPRDDGTIDHHYLQLDRLYFKLKCEMDPCQSADTQMSQQMQSVVQDWDAIVSAQMKRSDQNSEAGRTGECCTISMSKHAHMKEPDA